MNRKDQLAFFMLHEARIRKPWKFISQCQMLIILWIYFVTSNLERLRRQVKHIQKAQIFLGWFFHIELNIYVMSEVSSLRAAHHQHITIEHLRYQNQLLLRRNQLLSEENAKLLEHLEQALHRAQNCQAQKTQRIVQEQISLLEKAKIDFSSLFHGMDQKVERLVGGKVASYQKALTSDCSITQLYECLTTIIAKLLDDKSEKREGELRELINTTESRLTLRKQARDKTERIVHLIRDPPKQLQLTLRELREEGEQQRDIYQRIIRKVKRQAVNAHSLEEIYMQMSELMSVRYSIRQEEGRLAAAERQFELGRFNPLSLQTTAAQLQALNDSAKQLKARIEANIHALP